MLSLSKSVVFNFLFALLLLPAVSSAEMKPRWLKLPDFLTPEIAYLLDIAVNKKHNAFDPSRIGNILDFITCPKDQGVIHHPGREFEGTSAYHEFELQTDLLQILKFAYDPDIPSYVDSPSSIRVAYWKEVNGDQHNTLPHLWQLMGKNENPVIVRGVEHEEITPDLNTRVYYEYDVDRTLILFKHGSQNSFISLAKQKNKSGVGRKGIVLGSDKDWNYLYTGQKGVPKFGLGSFHSYMYDSCSIIVYLESNTHPKKVKCGIFKWLRAGWKNINMVQKHHIHRGLKRYADTLKSILENPSLPDISELSAQFSNIRALSNQDLKDRIIKYLESLERMYGHTTVLPGTRFSKLINKYDYIEQLTRREMESMLCLEYMKGILGKKPGDGQ